MSSDVKLDASWQGDPKPGYSENLLEFANHAGDWVGGKWEALTCICFPFTLLFACLAKGLEKEGGKSIDLGLGQPFLQPNWLGTAPNGEPLGTRKKYNEWV